MSTPVSLQIADVLEVRYYGWCQSRSQLAVNVTHMHVSNVTPTSPATVDLELISADLDADFATEYAAVMSDICHFLGCEVQKIWPTRSVFGASDGYVTKGTLAGDLLPAQVSGLIQWKTAVAGRHGKGRIYVPFPTESVNEADGVPNSGYLADLLLLGHDMQLSQSLTHAGTTIELEPVLFNRTTHGVTSIIQARTPGRWATQRRRGMYGRMNSLPDWVPLPLP